MTDTLSPDESERIASAATRREFLGQLASSAAVLAVAACTPPVVAGGGAGSAMTPAGASLPTLPPIAKWDDAWTKRLDGVTHKAVFDAPDIADGTVVSNAFVYMLSYKNVHGASDDQVRAVIVARHEGVPLAFGDALWSRYELGKRFRIKDPATGKWALRNPWASVSPDDKTAMAGASLEDLGKRGAIMLACNFAANYLGGELAKDSGENADAVRGMIRANLVPGFQLALSGIYATTRAQEAGCTFIRST